MRETLIEVGAGLADVVSAVFGVVVRVAALLAALTLVAIAVIFLYQFALVLIDLVGSLV